MTRDPNQYINDDMPVMIPLRTPDEIEVLPDYYERIKRKERVVYDNRGNRGIEEMYYAIRPLTGKELGALKSAHDTVLTDR